MSPQPLTRRRLLGGLLVTLVTPFATEAHQCECEFYRGKNAIGNTVYRDATAA